MNQAIYKQFPARLPEALHGAITGCAKENNRSTNAEVVYRLEQSFNEPELLDTEVVAKLFTGVMTNVITELFTTCFERLEARVVELLDHPLHHVHSVSIDATDSELEELRASMKATGSYSELSDLYQGIGYKRFDFPGRPGSASPTGRLSDTDPELQDLPPVSGISTLAASLRARGCLCGGGVVGFHTGGLVGDPGLKDGEVPAILGATNVMNYGQARFPSTARPG